MNDLYKLNPIMRLSASARTEKLKAGEIITWWEPDGDKNMKKPTLKQQLADLTERYAERAKTLTEVSAKADTAKYELENLQRAYAGEKSAHAATLSELHCAQSDASYYRGQANAYSRILTVVHSVFASDKPAV